MFVVLKLEKYGEIISNVTFMELANDNNKRFQKDFESLYTAIEDCYVKKASVNVTTDFGKMLKDSFKANSSTYYISNVTPNLKHYEENKLTLENSKRLFKKLTEKELIDNPNKNLSSAVYSLTNLSNKPNNKKSIRQDSYSTNFDGSRSNPKRSDELFTIAM